MYKIAFVCVDYNGWEHTRKFCDSLERQQGLDAEFEIACVVVDNSASEQSREELRDISARHRWATYVSAGRNIGYFGGLNFGLDSLNLEDWNSVVICNNDLEFEGDFCRRLAAASYSQNILSVCPDVITRDGVHQNPHVLERISTLKRFQYDLYFSHYFVARILIGILRVLRPKKALLPQPKDGCTLHMGIGACYVLTRAFLSRFKTLSYPHFLYGEEAFFSDQIHSAGGVLWFDPALVVHHAESAATSKVPKRVTYEYARRSYSDYRDML